MPKIRDPAVIAAAKAAQCPGIATCKQDLETCKANLTIYATSLAHLEGAHTELGASHNELEHTHVELMANYTAIKTVNTKLDATCTALSSVNEELIELISEMRKDSSFAEMSTFSGLTCFCSLGLRIMMPAFSETALTVASAVPMLISAFLTTKMYFGANAETSDFSQLREEVERELETKIQSMGEVKEDQEL